MLALVLFGLTISVVVGALLYGSASLRQAGLRAQASFLAEQGLEAVRNIRDDSFANLNDGGYGLTLDGSAWELTSGPDETGVFTRQITISSVSPTLKQIDVTVTWEGFSQSISTSSASSYLADWGQP